MSFVPFILFLMLCFGCQNQPKHSPPNITAYYGAQEAYQGPKDEVRLLNSFPKGLYWVQRVEGLGSFYLENDGSYDYIKGFLRAGKPWEEHLVEVMERYITPGSTVLDIGAHIGTHTLTLSKFAGKAGKVYAFEPQMKIYSELTHNLMLNGCTNTTAYRCALGDAVKSIEMCPATAENEGGTPIGVGGDHAEMVTLDSLNLEGISFIKLDVENVEYEVLLGARETLRKCRPYILIEIMGNYEYECEDRDEIQRKTHELLGQYGYTLTYIKGWDWLATPIEKAR